MMTCEECDKKTETIYVESSKIICKKCLPDNHAEYLINQRDITYLIYRESTRQWLPVIINTEHEIIIIEETE